MGRDRRLRKHRATRYPIKENSVKDSGPCACLLLSPDMLRAREQGAATKNRPLHPAMRYNLGGLLKSCAPRAGLQLGHHVYKLGNKPLLSTNAGLRRLIKAGRARTDQRAPTAQLRTKTSSMDDFHDSAEPPRHPTFISRVWHGLFADTSVRNSQIDRIHSGSVSSTIVKACSTLPGYKSHRGIFRARAPGAVDHTSLPRLGPASRPRRFHLDVGLPL